MENVKQYEAITVETLQRSLDRISQLDKGNVNLDFAMRRVEIDREYGKFDGFWRSLYESVREKFDEQSAKEFQRKVLTYHIQHNDGGYSDGLKFLIGFDMSYSEYEQLKTEVLGSKNK